MNHIQQGGNVHAPPSLDSWEMQEPLRNCVAQHLAARDLLSLMRTCRSLRDTLSTGLDDVWRDAATAFLPQGHPKLALLSQPTAIAVLNSYSLAQRNLAAGRTTAVLHSPMLLQQAGYVSWLAFSPDARHIAMLMKLYDTQAELTFRQKVSVLCANTGQMICESELFWQNVDAGLAKVVWGKEGQHVILGRMQGDIGAQFASFSALTGRCTHSAACKLNLDELEDPDDYVHMSGFDISITGEFAYLEMKYSGEVYFVKVACGTVLFRLSEVIPDHLKMPTMLTIHSAGFIVPTQQGFSLLDPEAQAVTMSWPWNTTADINRADLSPDGTLLCISSVDSTSNGCSIVSASGMQEILVLPGITSVSFSADSAMLVGNLSNAGKTHSQIWDVGSRQCLATAECVESGLPMSLSLGSRFFAMSDSMLLIYNTHCRSHFPVLALATCAPFMATWSPDSSALAHVCGSRGSEQLEILRFC